MCPPSTPVLRTSARRIQTRGPQAYFPAAVIQPIPGTDGQASRLDLDYGLHYFTQPLQSRGALRGAPCLQ